MFIRAMREGVTERKKHFSTYPFDSHSMKSDRSDLITSFMKDLFQRRLVTFNQLTTEIVFTWPLDNNLEQPWSFLDCILYDQPASASPVADSREYDNPSSTSLKLNDHNRHLMAQLMVTNFHKFIGQLSNEHLVRIAYLTISKISQIKRELLVFCRCAARNLDHDDIRNHADANPSWVISELQDIISTGFNGMRTIRRIQKLSLPKDNDGPKNEDLIAGLKRHLKDRERQIEELKCKTPSYEPEINNYVDANFGLNATANNALIIGEYRKA